MGVRLEWDGKPTHVERISLPFQTVETINESRATRERDAGSLVGRRRAGHVVAEPAHLGRQQVRRAYLATGHYSDQLADARWVA